jgi:hypothetical protein
MFLNRKATMLENAANPLSAKLRMIVMSLLMLGAMLALLAGCVRDAVVLIHPQTRKEAQCGPYYFTGTSSGIISEAAAEERERDCINDYQQKGYERR